jgi:2-polyprenyl-3-methyl-5-hydroxy-6-metoxy-1,4-benzoquinol methylase
VVDASCNLCGENRFRIVEDGEIPFRVLRCLRCSLVFVDPQPERQALGEHYNEGYYREWTGVQRERRLGMWGARLDRLERRVSRGRLLDVGCAEGTFLELAKRRGWEVSGTELSAYAAAEASRRLGAEIFCGELSEARYPDCSFDVVTLWHVLEHVRNPGDCLREIRRIIRPQGFLLIAVPNVDDWLMQMAYRIVRGRPKRLFSKKDREIHLTHFSARTIRMYLEKAQFAPFWIGPDCGIIEPGKKLINAVAAACRVLGDLKIYNALEVHARPAVRDGRT